MILNLAIWFGLHVLFGTVGTFNAGPFAVAWPEWSSLNLAALALSLVAALCLFRLKLGVLLTLALCGGIGLALSLLPNVD